jgi:hypothetical protein
VICAASFFARLATTNDFVINSISLASVCPDTVPTIIILIHPHLLYLQLYLLKDYGTTVINISEQFVSILKKEKDDISFR